MRSKRWRFARFTVASLLLTSMALSSFAQMYRYDAATEVTLTGSVQAVSQVMGPRGWGGTHLSLKTDRETIDVRVGPSWFLTQNKLSFAPGDQVEVTGSRVPFGDQDALIAREIKKGNEKLTLRDAQGAPVWAGHHKPIS